MTGALFWWALGLNLFMYHASAFLIFSHLLYTRMRENRGLYIPPSSVFFFLIFIAYAFTIVIHAPSGDGSRILAAGYNLSFWLMGSALIVLIANVFSLDAIKPIFKAFTYLAWASAFVAAAMLAAWFAGIKTVSFATPLYPLTAIIGRTTLVETSLMVRPLLFDWFASMSQPRFNVFSPYPTAGGAIIMISLLVILSQARLEKKTLNYRFLILFGINLLALFMTLSRMCILAFAFSLIVTYIVGKKHFILWLMLFVFIFIGSLPFLIQAMEFMLSLRQGSNDSRMALYRMSIEQLQGMEWLVGKGLKPRYEFKAFPLGSHSTYVSLLYKTGLLGFLIFCASQISLIWRWFCLKNSAVAENEHYYFWQALGLVILSMSLWMITEDIDAPQLLAFLYFSMVGCFEGLHKELSK